MLMTDFTSLAPFRKEEENESRSLKKLILINRTLGVGVVSEFLTITGHK